MKDAGWWRSRLERLCTEHQVPGAALGLLRHGHEPITVAAGVADAETGAPASIETAFQIGSISKVMTATALMRLVDAGQLDLHRPVTSLVPELVAAGDDGHQLTPHHLLTHTSGLAGDVLRDLGDGADCLASYVRMVADLPRVHPLGRGCSYSNAGFVVAGLLIERLTGELWDDAMRRLVLTPLGMRHSYSLPEHAGSADVAVSHLHVPGADPTVSPLQRLPRSLGPAGLFTCSIGDVLTFVRMHLGGGTADDGSRVLRTATAALMQRQQSTPPEPHSVGDSYGLAWCRRRWSSELVMGHDGTTFGQAAYLRMVPRLGGVIALLTNGGRADDLADVVIHEAAREQLGVRIPPSFAPRPGVTAQDRPEVSGDYARPGVRISVRRTAKAITMTVTQESELDGLGDIVNEWELVAAQDDLYAVRTPGTTRWRAVRFYTGEDGESYLHFGARAAHRVA